MTVVRSRVVIAALVGSALSAAILVAVLLSIQGTDPFASYDPGSAPTSIPSNYLSVGFVGDSYTGGTAEGGGPLTENWTTLALDGISSGDRKFRAYRATVDGAGYVRPGATGATLVQATPNAVTPDAGVVVLFGGRSDVGEQGVRSAASAALAEVVRIAPRARLLVIGPLAMRPSEVAGLSNVRDEIRQAALGAGAVFVDPLEERWFIGAGTQLVGEDGVSPTPQGHAYLAEKIRPHLQEAIERAVAQ